MRFASGNLVVPIDPELNSLSGMSRNMTKEKKTIGCLTCIDQDFQTSVNDTEIYYCPYCGNIMGEITKGDTMTDKERNIRIYQAAQCAGLVNTSTEFWKGQRASGLAPNDYVDQLILEREEEDNEPLYDLDLCHSNRPVGRVFGQPNKGSFEDYDLARQLEKERTQHE
jgi:hypothetical protein